MTQLKHLEEAMSAQFIWDKEGMKKFQVNESMEGSKDLARMIFVGIADMFGFDKEHVMEFLDMEYESHRTKLAQFKKNYKEGLDRKEKGTSRLIDDPISKTWFKTKLCLNSIDFKYRMKPPYLKLADWLNYE